MAIGLVGTSFRRGGVESLVESLAKAKLLPLDLASALGLDELVLLSTCNRVELVFASALGVAQVRQALQERFGVTLYAYDEEGAVEHLCCVASAIDSMVPGEVEILGQVKAAWQSAVDADLVGPELGPVFEHVFATAKEVRAKTTLFERPVSISSLAAATIPKDGPVAFVGAGRMIQGCAAALHARGHSGAQWLFVNRTLARAVDLAQTYGGQSMAWPEFLARPPTLRTLVSATRAPAPVLGSPFFARCASLDLVIGLIIDLAMPPDVERATLPKGCEYYGLARLEELTKRHQEERGRDIAVARAIIDRALERYLRDQAAVRASGAVRTLREEFRRVTEDAVAAVLPKLPSLSADERARLALWARALSNRLAHQPTMALKESHSEAVK